MSNTLEPTIELPYKGVTREDLYQLLKTINMGLGSADGKTIDVVNGAHQANLSVPRWVKFTVTFDQLATAGTSNDIELFVLPAGGIIHAVKIKQSVAFVGGGISAYTLSVGIAGSLAKYKSAFSVFDAPGDTVFQTGSTLGGETHAAAGKSIRVAAVSTTANLNAATAGTADIWVMYSAAA